MAKKYLTDLDLAKNNLLNARIQNLASAPSSPVAGQIYWDTTLHQFGVYNDNTTSWVYLAAASGANVSKASNAGQTNTLQVSGGADKTIADYAPGGTGIVKVASTGVPSLATSGTDYAPATSGTTALKGNGSGGFSTATLNDVGAATADYSLNSHKITNLLDPASAQDAATKNYVDATSQGLSIKPSARVATTGSETFTITSGSVTQITGLTVDGVTLAVGDRVLIKDAPAATGAGSANSTQPGNGVYSVTANTTNLTVARVADLSGSNNPSGAFVFVEAGTTNATAGYVVSTPSSAAAFTYGTGNIAWAQFSGAGEVTAGSGLSKSGNTLSIENSGVLTVPHGGTGAATLTGIVKGNGAGAMTAATAGTDYAAATSGSNILKGNGSGGFSSAKFTATIGDGSTTAIAVTHSLGTQDVIAQIRDASTNAVVECDIAQTSTTVTTFTFATAPATNAYKVVIIG